MSNISSNKIRRNGPKTFELLAKFSESTLFGRATSPIKIRTICPLMKCAMQNKIICMASAWQRDNCVPGRRLMPSLREHRRISPEIQRRGTPGKSPCRACWRPRPLHFRTGWSSRKRSQGLFFSRPVYFWPKIRFSQNRKKPVIRLLSHPYNLK